MAGKFIEAKGLSKSFGSSSPSRLPSTACRSRSTRRVRVDRRLHGLRQIDAAESALRRDEAGYRHDQRSRKCN